MRPVCPALLLLLLFAMNLTAAASSDTITKTSAYHEIVVQDEDAEVTWQLNYTIAVRSITLSLTFILPENASLISLSDIHGAIIDYTRVPMRQGDEIGLKTRNDGNWGPLAVTIRYSIKDFAPQQYGRLRISSPLCLATTDEVVAHVILPQDAVLLSSFPQATPGSREATFTYLHDCIKLIYKRGEQFDGVGGYYDYSSKRYEAFAPEITPKMKKEIGEVEDAYGLLSNITGLASPHEKWVLAFVPSGADAKDKEAGSYTGTGLIYIREEALNDDLGPVIMHETMHGFNSEPLAWSKEGGSFWFEEGTASYAAHLYSLARGLEEADFFVKNSRYYSSTYDELADYYKSNSTRMETWGFDTLDSFSYDYSQFIIRAYVDAYGAGALRQAYACFPRVPDKNMSDPQTRNAFVLGCLSLAAGNVSSESILYPGKALFLSNEHDFERYAAAIGSGQWQGQEKPLPASAYALPPLPNEQEASDALTLLAGRIQNDSGAFQSSDALEIFSQATAEYARAKSLFDAEQYDESLAASSRAGALLFMAEQREQASLIEQQAGAIAAGIPTQSGSQQKIPCAPAFSVFSLAGLAAFASVRRSA
ncbi:Uncharacterised protein [Candidatus Burarchaeum australiense]|nr:Uncharacterised protein [Candidatus Burarchaeum australiense]